MSIIQTIPPVPLVKLLLDVSTKTLTYTSGVLTLITYADGSTKALNYTSGTLTSVVTTAASGLASTKTLGYTGGKLTSITVS